MLHPVIFPLLFQLMLSCSPAGMEADKLIRNDTAQISAQNIAFAAKDDSPEFVNAYENIPEWYLTNRVQIHTRLTLEDISKADFFGFPEKLAKYHATVLTRQIKSGDEEPWWPSKEGKMNPKVANFNANGQNLAKRIIDQMHSLNMKAIIYYRHLEDAEMLKEHPDWACKDVNGNLIKNPRGVTMSFNSPYRDVVIERLKELTSYGADGFYFDEVHVPFRGDFSDYSKAAYKKLYGTDMVSDFKKGNKLRYFEFRNKTIEQFFTDIRTSLAQEGKNPVILVSGNSWPTQTDLHMNSEIYQHFILKSESNIPLKATVAKGNFKMPGNLESKVSLFGLNAFFYSLMRDNSAGPPHIWCPKIRTADDAIATAAGLISLGCIANLDIDANTSDLNNFKVPLQWNIEYGKYFKNLSPYAFEGILVSEKERNAFIQTPEKAWQNVLMPAYLNFQKLYAAGIPLRIVSDASMTKNNVDQLKSVYCNKSLTKLPGSLTAQENKFIDFSAVPDGNEKQLAISLGSPIFTQKENKNIHVNYFTDPDGYLYIISAKDIKVPVKDDNDNITIPLPPRNDGNSVSGNYIIYIKQGNISDPQLEDLVNKTTIKSTGTENGYYAFNIKNNGNTALNMLRFKFKQ